MSQHVTPDMLEGVYTFLRTTQPFRAWKLPEAEEVGFHVVTGDNEFGCTVYDDKKCTFLIKISDRKHTQPQSLLPTMAHEMCHIREWQLKVRSDVHHGAIFKKLAAQVCRLHHFEIGQF